VKQLCHLRKQNQSKGTKSIEFALSRQQKAFTFTNEYLLPFSNFAIIEEMASSQFVSSASEHCIGLQRMQKKDHYWRSFI
jgi:hypothetical protein